jgi:hypothetical protein
MTVGRIPVIEGGIQPTIFDAKADLLTATANDTPARLAVGTNGLNLVADSTATTGLKWGYVTNPAAYLMNSGSLTISNATWTKVTFDEEQFDTSAFHSTATNTSRITIPAGLGGKYVLHANVKWANNATGPRIVRYRINNTTTIVTQEKSSAAEFSDQLSSVYELTAGDYVDLEVYQASGGNLTLYGNSYDVRCTNFSISYLGA